MNRNEIESMIGESPSWLKATEEAKEAFVQQMDGRYYGANPLLNSWSWFNTGWLRAKAASRKDS